MNKSSFLGRFLKIFALDLWLLIGLLAITGYGLLVLYSASGGSEKMFTNRVIQVCLGLGVMFVMAMFPPRFYEKVSPYLYVVCIILLILVDVAGEISKGAQRWLNLGFIRFQPSEIAKLS
ncbi:FtsW/RodA/SpoVE family cell cycle protein, partial [Glaesserella parasuis]